MITKYNIILKYIFLIFVLEKMKNMLITKDKIVFQKSPKN